MNALSIVALSFALLLANAQRLPPCSRSRHCDDSNPATLDFCVTRYSFCQSVRKALPDTDSPGQSAGLPFRLTTLDKLIDETNAKPLSLADKLSIIDAAKTVVEGITPHRFIQLNVYRHDAIQPLNALRRDLVAGSRKNRTSNASFHRAMDRIFSGLNDYHTVYLPPSPIAVSFAFLGFYVRQFFASGSRRRRYVVSDIPDDFRSVSGLEDGSSFREGVEIMTYDGIPVDKAVRRLGRQGKGSNLAARIDNGMFLLSFRFMALEATPLKKKIRIGYRDADGAPVAVDMPWTFMTIPNGTVGDIIGISSQAPVPAVHGFAENEGTVLGTHGRAISKGEPLVKAGKGNRRRIAVNAPFELQFGAEILDTKAGRFGLFTLPIFNSTATQPIIDELTRIFRLMPKEGMIIDARRNPGGRADFAKLVSELVSDNPIEQMRESARATNITRDIFLADTFLDRSFPDEREDFTALQKSLSTALRAGEEFTGPYGSLFTNRPRAPRAYHGPVVSVVDALTYSAGDIFASLQVDQNISLLVGTSDSTGAGGASTTLYNVFAGAAPRALKALPGGVDFLMAFARFYRLGTHRGAIIETFGIAPHIRYYPTYNDAVHDDVDLFGFLGAKLKEMRS